METTTSAWFEKLDDAMDLLTTSRRLTCRSNRVVTRCAMDSIDIDATTTTRRAARCGFDAVKIDFSMPRRSSDHGFHFDYDDASGIRNTFFEDYCDFPKRNIKTTSTSGNFRLKPPASSSFKSEEHFRKGSKTRPKVSGPSLFLTGFVYALCANKLMSAFHSFSAIMSAFSLTIHSLFVSISYNIHFYLVIRNLALIY